MFKTGLVHSTTFLPRSEKSTHSCVFRAVCRVPARPIGHASATMTSLPKATFRYSHLIIQKTTNHTSKALCDEGSDDAPGRDHGAGRLICQAAWLGCCIDPFKHALVFARPEDDHVTTSPCAQSKGHPVRIASTSISKSSSSRQMSFSTSTTGNLGSLFCARYVSNMGASSACLK